MADYLVVMKSKVIVTVDDPTQAPLAAMRHAVEALEEEWEACLEYTVVPIDGGLTPAITVIDGKEVR